MASTATETKLGQGPVTRAPITPAGAPRQGEGLNDGVVKLTPFDLMEASFKFCGRFEGIKRAKKKDGTEFGTSYMIATGGKIVEVLYFDGDILPPVHVGQCVICKGTLESDGKYGIRAKPKEMFAVDDAYLVAESNRRAAKAKMEAHFAATRPLEKEPGKDSPASE